MSFSDLPPTVLIYVLTMRLVICRLLPHITRSSNVRPRRSYSAAAYSRRTFWWTIWRSVPTCTYVRRSVGRSVQCIVEKTADRIRTPFGIIGRTGPGMRHVVGFGNRLTGRYTFGANLVRAVVTNGDFTAYVCESAVTRPSSHITLGGVVFITSCAVHGYNKNCVLHPRPFR